MTSLHEYELAIIACPCRQQLSTYCTYCRLILEVESERILNSINEYEVNLQTTKKLTKIPPSSSNDDAADSSLSKSKVC
jgi:hypothetical protein